MAAKKSSAAAPKIDIDALKRVLASPEPIPLSGPDGAFEKKPAKGAMTAIAPLLAIEKRSISSGKSAKAVEFVTLTPEGVSYLCKAAGLDETPKCATRYLRSLLSARIAQLEAQVSSQKSLAVESLTAATESIAEQGRLVEMAANALRSFLANAQKDLSAAREALNSARAQSDASLSKSEASLESLRKELENTPAAEAPSAPNPNFSTDAPPTSLQDLKDTVQRWRVASDQSERERIAAVLRSAGAKLIGEPGQRVDFSSRHHRSGTYVSSGDPVIIDSPGWEVPEADGYVLLQAQVSSIP